SFLYIYHKFVASLQKFKTRKSWSRIRISTYHTSPNPCTSSLLSYHFPKRQNSFIKFYTKYALLYINLILIPNDCIVGNSFPCIWMLFRINLIHCKNSKQDKTDWN